MAQRSGWRIVAAAVVLLAVGATGASGALASPALSVRITSAPPSTSASSDATFAWVATETAQFACALDGARATACSSPKTYTGLAEGVHVFIVTATNTDRAGNNYSARDTHRWTIDLPGGPPPPPPPPPPATTAKLLVNIEGGGEVSSEPAGIDCPGDCEQSFPVGTKVTLSQKAAPGSRFAGWNGGCEGTGGCAPAVSATTLVLAAFTAVGPEPHLYRGDREGDGLSNAKDACPFSPRGLKPLVAGCTAVDLLNGADSASDDANEAAEAARQKLHGVKGLQVFGRGLSTVMDLIEAAAVDAAQGDPCGSAAGIGKSTPLLAKGNALVGAMQKGVAKQAAPDGEGDASEKDLQLAGLHYRQGLVQQAATKVEKLRRAYAAVCGSLGQKVELVGRVGKSKDAEGLLQLQDGRVVALAGADYDAGDIAEGTRVKIVGRRIGKGPWLAQSVVGLGKPKLTLSLKPCISLRIAPVQEFGKPNPILHSPKGYSFNGVLRLEAGMRFAASPECANAKSGRYSLMIVLSSSKGFFTVAADLDSNDAPVPISVAGSSTVWTIRVFERYQASNCPPPSSSGNSSKEARTTTAATKSFPCPVQTFSTIGFKARVLDQGVYGSAVYEKTILPLESSAPQPAKVEAIYPLHFTIQASKATFEGEGYKPGGSPGSMTTVKLAEPFALWPDEYYGAPLLFPLETIGVDHFAGLIWPRIVGTRNGQPFRYVAQLPSLVKDLLPDCPSAKCFHRLPWKVSTGAWTVQGNGPGFSHKGKQLYAYDFVMDDGDTIYATRGGVVGDLVESNSQNFNPCADNNGNGIEGDEEDKEADGPTNFVRIDHQDGTYSYYAHVRKNSVIPAKDAVVERGDPIASVGNVGRSCGPHLHYQVSIDKTDTIYGQTIASCFEGWLLPFFGFHKCYTPVKDDAMVSTNG